MSTQPDTTTGTATLTRGRAVAMITALIIGILAYQLNSSMLNPALPDIAKDLKVGVDAISQIVSLFFLAGAVGGVVLTRWSDFIGRRRMFIGILVLLGIGTLLCLFAPNLPVLIVGRVLQGATGAAFSLSYIILNENLSAKAFGTAMGVVTAVNGGVGGVDAYAGGLLSDTIGYRSIFVVVLIFGLAGLAMIWTMVPKDGAAKSAGKMDWWGAAIFSIGLICLTYFVSEGSSLGWGAPLTLLFLALTIAAAIAFWLVEKGVRSPLVAVEHLRSRRVWPVIATTLLTLCGVFAVINFSLVIITQNPHAGLHMSASTSALLILTPPALIGVAAAPVSGWLAGKFGWLRMLRLGLILCILGVVTVIVFPTTLAAIIVSVVVLGIAYNGLALTTLNGLGVLQSPKEEPGILPGLNGAAFGIGASLGIGVVAPYIGLGTFGGFTTGLIISGVLTVLAFLASLLIQRAPAQSA